MLQKTYTDEEVEQFYRDFEAAGIRKPVATLARLSGLSTGNVSEYLKRKKKASDKLINVFYEHYGSSINVPREVRPKENYMAGDDLHNFSYAHRKVVDTNAELVKFIVRGQPGTHSDQVLAPKVVELIREAFSGKKQVSFDELSKLLDKALTQGNGHR